MVLKFRASIPGSKVFMREYEVRGETSLYELHSYLTDDMGFSPDQMVLFRGVDSKGTIGGEYGLFDFGDGAMDSVSLSELLKKGEKTLLYVFDLKRERYIKLDCIGEAEESLRFAYPRLVAEKGRNPEQFAKGYDDLDQVDEPFREIPEEPVYDDAELPEGEEFTE